MNTTGLTDDEIRVRIAEACGWRALRPNPLNEKLLAGFNDKQGATEVANAGSPWGVPDYLNDLNAMHAAEKSIKCRHTLALYDEYLRREVNPNTDRLAKDWTWEELGRAARATARQRALAFVAMLPEPEAGR